MHQSLWRNADAAKDHSALLQRFEGVTAELGRVREGAADMRLRLDHFTGPAGPQARIRQLEGSLQTVRICCAGAMCLWRCCAISKDMAVGKKSSYQERCGWLLVIVSAALGGLPQHVVVQKIHSGSLSCCACAMPRVYAVAC